MLVFQQRIREQRKAYNLTQRQIADILGMTHSAYLRYENGTAEPTLETLVKLAEIYDVSVDFLVGRKEL